MNHTEQVADNAELVAQWMQDHGEKMTCLMTEFHHPHVMSIDYTDNEHGVRTAVEELANIPMTVTEGLEANNDLYRPLAASGKNPAIYNSRFVELTGLITYQRLKDNGMTISERPSWNPSGRIRKYLELVAVGDINEAAERQLAAHIARYFSQEHYYSQYGVGQFLYELQHTFATARPDDKALTAEHRKKINEAVNRLRVLTGLVDTNLAESAEDIQPWLDENRAAYQQLLAEYEKREEAHRWAGSNI